MPRIRKRYGVLAACALVVASCFGACTCRVPIHAERDGWVLDYSHRLIGCPVCTAELRRLECNGRPVPVPWQPDSSHQKERFQLSTPVGRLEVWAGRPGYHPYSADAQKWPESEESISPDELARGWYDAPWFTRDQGEPGARKSGTPAHWCLGTGEKHARWLDPAVIDQLDW